MDKSQQKGCRAQAEDTTQQQPSSRARWVCVVVCSILLYVQTGASKSEASLSGLLFCINRFKKQE